MTRRLRLCAALALLLTFRPAARAEDGVPVYEMPAGITPPALARGLDDAASRAAAAVLDPASSEDAEEAVRVLAGLGKGALPQVVRALSGATWYARASLVGAVAEMDAPEATPLLIAACGDPAFAVREAAVLGLGKTGDARGAAALVERSSAQTEPIWRVRVAAATALRRAVLRRSIDRSAGEAALVAMLSDPDDDARRAALREVAPLAAEAALPAVLAVFSDPKTSSTDRTISLSALRAYRSPKPELLAALRRGFLEGAGASEAVEAGRALLAMQGVAALSDEDVAETVLHRLKEGGDHEALREGLARLGRPVAPWLVDEARRIAGRVASGRANHGETPFDDLLDTLIQVDEAAGLAFVKELLGGPDAGTLDAETWRAALRKVEFIDAPKMGAELRAIFDAKPADSSQRPDLLRVIVASGGDDLGARLDAALASPKLRGAALDLLKGLPGLPAGANLVALAREAADPVERLSALETLSRRDPKQAAGIGAGLLDDPRADLRSKAIDVLSASRSPEDFDRLVARLAVEDGADVRPTKPAGSDPPSPASGTTPSEHASGVLNRRRELIRALVKAVGTTGGERARPVLLQLAESDSDAVAREAAATELRGIVKASDAAKLVALETAEPDHNTRREILRTLATLGDAPEAVQRFETLVADSRTRSDALALLKEDGASVVTGGLLAGLEGRDWTDEDRAAALKALERAGRGLDAAKLAAIVADARTHELRDEAARILGERPEPEATHELLRLIGSISDLERLSCVVEALGSRAAPEAEAPLLDLFARVREQALAAQFGSDAAVDVYRKCADAVAEFDSERTGEALVEHLLDPRLIRAVGRRSVLAEGPFQPEECAPVQIVRSLVTAFARRDEASCRRLLAARLDALRATARDLAIPEGFAAGVARYLEAPTAYRLPARPRGAAALLLWQLVLRSAPRMSPLDVFAEEACDGQLAQDGRWREAAAALRGCVALADVENAARPPEDRMVENARIAVRTAQALASEGRADEALAIARKLREPDPTSGELAYREGWCLARLGRADSEALGALQFAAAQDDKDPRIHFQIGWVTEQTDGPTRALPFYEQAVLLDHKRFEEAGTSTDFHGAPYEAAAYSYWCARALHAAGRDRDAHGCLKDAVSRDDRFAEQAKADRAFSGWNELDAAVAEGLDDIRIGAMR